MSTWTDIRDAITAPVRNLVDIVVTPFEVVHDVLQGKNVLESLEKGAGSIAGSLALQITGPAGSILATQTGQNLLKNDTLSALTLGYTADYAGALNTATKLQKNESVTKDDWLSTGRFFTKTAVVGGGAAALSATGTSITSASATLGTANVVATAVKSKDVLGLAASLTGGALPGGAQDVKDLFGAVHDAVGIAQPAPAAPGAPTTPPGTYVFSPWQNSGEPAASAPVAAQAGIPLAVMAGVGVLALLALSKGRK